ncbi:hypothetical protein COY95_02805, partial [Candidatus Woesearchaeota archaeon CG_4_10_14_0_8_um_filter_47_5]
MVTYVQSETRYVSPENIITEVLDEICEIIFLAPHYDDLPLSIGGIVRVLNGAVRVTNVNVFSLSQYVSPEYNDPSIPGDALTLTQERIRFVTDIRKREDEQCLGLLGITDLIYLDKNEAPLRGYLDLDGSSGITFPLARPGWHERESGLVEELKRTFKDYMKKKGNVFVPLVIKYHIDHTVVRRAALDAARELYNEGKLEATVFFYEDQPYAGLSDSSLDDWSDVRIIIECCQAYDILIDLEEKLRLIDFYPSQREEGYENGVRNRAQIIGEEYPCTGPAERFYKLDPSTLAEL